MSKYLKSEQGQKIELHNLLINQIAIMSCRLFLCLNSHKEVDFSNSGVLYFSKSKAFLATESTISNNVFDRQDSP